MEEQEGKERTRKRREKEDTNNRDKDTVNALPDALICPEIRGNIAFIEAPISRYNNGRASSQFLW